jgi:uncharacterized membrane protein
LRKRENRKNRRVKRVNFETSKNLAGVGAILLFAGVLPYINSYFIVPIVGVILLLIGLKGLSEYYNEAGIFNNTLYGTIVTIVGIVVVAAVVFTALLGMLAVIVPNWNGDFVTLAQQFSSADWINWSANLTFGDFAPYIGMLILAYVLMFVFALVTALLLRRSLGLLAAKSGVGLFGSTGTIMLIGGVLTIVLFGYIILWVAVLLLAVALFQARPPMRPQAPVAPPPTYQATV